MHKFKNIQKEQTKFSARVNECICKNYINYEGYINYFTFYEQSIQRVCLMRLPQHALAFQDYKRKCNDVDFFFYHWKAKLNKVCKSKLLSNRQ